MRPIPENEKTNFFFQQRVTWLEILILLALALIIFLTGLLEVPFHVDETFWMASSVRWDTWIGSNLNHEVWAEDYDTYEVRPIPSYLVAISQRAAGITPEQNPLSFSESWEDYAQGVDLRPADEILYFARLPMAIVAAISIVLMSLFLALHVSRLAGYWFYLLSFNAYFLLHLRRAMTESILVLFTILILMATLKLLNAIRAKDTRGVALCSFLIGLLGGLAGQSKLTGLGCLIVSLLAAFVILLQEKQETGVLDRKHLAILSLVIPFVSFSVFVAVYPFFYTNTIERILNTLVYRVGVTHSQIEQFDWAVVSGGRAGFLLERVFVDLIPTGSHQMTVILAVLVLGLTVYGIILSIKKLREKQITSPAGRNDFLADFYLILLLSALILAGPMLLTPLDWRRYFLYPVFFALVFAALGLEGAIKGLATKLK